MAKCSSSTPRLPAIPTFFSLWPPPPSPPTHRLLLLHCLSAVACLPSHTRGPTTIDQRCDAPHHRTSPPGRQEMDSRSQAPHKCSSFSPATIRDDGKPREVDRNLSLGAVRHGKHERRDQQPGAGIAREQIKEECEEEEDSNAAAGQDGDGGGCVNAEGAAGGEGGEPDLAALSGEIDAFIVGQDGDAPGSIPEATLEKFASAVEQEIAQSESAQDKWATDAIGEPRALLAAITRIAALSSALAKNPEGSGKCTAGVHRVTGVLHRAMA